MGYSSCQLNISYSLPRIKSAPFFSGRLKRLDVSLLIEIALVTTVVVLAISVFNTSSFFESGWLVAPGILVAGALAPTVIKRRRFPGIGFGAGQITTALPVVFLTCVVTFPAVFYGLWLLKSYGVKLALQPGLSHNQEWISWLFYQFMYVAVAEEVFFRGYVQSNILRLMNTARPGQHRLQQWISICISAAFFAVAHIIVRGQIISGLTFLPGLILGWLFIRTKSLLAPILFHGLANTCYCITAAILA